MGDQKSTDPPPPRLLARYWHEATRPLVSMAFVAPMLLAYEGGLLALGPQAMRNGADVWLRHGLQALGFGQYFLLPLLTCSALLGWHHVKRHQWHVDPVVLWGMLIESLIFGLLLIVLAELQRSLLASRPQFTSLEGAGTLGQVIAFVGAGIYEELLFRLLLIPVLAMVLRGGGVSRRTSLMLAILFSSLLFAAAHYQFDVTIAQVHLAASTGDSFEWTSFLFRLSAGIFFSVLLIYRGFGIAVGTHTLYDILVSFA